MTKVNLHILMLEDEPLDAELNRAQLDLLDEYACDISLVGDRESYLNALDTTTPDIVLSDYNLPQYDGLQALNDLKNRNPLIPFIFVTGTLNEETAVETIKAGAWDYVVKDRLFRLPFAVRSVLKLKEEKQLAAQAEEKVQRLLTAIEQTSAQIIVSSFEGKIEYVNKKFTEITGYDSEEVIGKDAFEFLSNNNSGRLSGTIENLKKGHIYRGEVLNEKKDGTLYWELISITPITNAENQITNFVTVKEDITQHKILEQELIEALKKAEQSDKLKDVFLQNLSHEVRTPLNAIVGFSDLLFNRPDNSEEVINNFTSIIKKSSNQLLTIVSDILTISSIQTGQEIVYKSPVNIDLMLDDLYDLYKPVADEKKLELLLIRNNANKNLLIQTDQTKLNQILINLIDNAIKFTQKGSVIIKCNLTRENFEFSVQDTGIGISKEAQKIIFERFRQAEPSIHIQYGGNGLGLSISKSYAEMLGGSIRVESEPGKGATFYLILPCVSKEDARAEEKSRSFELVNKKLTLLVAEDEHNNFLIVQEILSGNEITLIHARNGLEAIKVCETSPEIDLVLMDIQMPIMDGIQAFREIRKLRRNLPVIAQTAYALEKERRQFLEIGFNDYISKPITKNSLISVINKAILTPD